VIPSVVPVHVEVIAIAIRVPRVTGFVMGLVRSAIMAAAMTRALVCVISSALGG